MTNPVCLWSPTLQRSLQRMAFLLFVFGALALITTSAAQAQTFTVLHDFTDGPDGARPQAGVAISNSGALYGTTYYGGTHGYGVVFKLMQLGSGWALNPLYEFRGGSDGEYPQAPVAVGPNGALYGTTYQGGSGNFGTVFEVQPSAAACKTAICYWNETVLHSFQGAGDGEEPGYGSLTFDQAGNIYGTTQLGGAYGGGAVFELSQSGGTWAESVLYSFGPYGSDGEVPIVGVIFDRAGNLYGTTWMGGTSDGGTAFELSPSGGMWTENILYDFPSYQGLVVIPSALIMDQSGNLYGATRRGGDGNGVVYELTRSGGSWSFSTLYTFASTCYPGLGPVAMDRAGDLYGVCGSGGRYDSGWVFELTNSGGSWTVTDLYDFTGQSDGSGPVGGVVLDSSGNLYGTTELGGNLGWGTVWEVAP